MLKRVVMCRERRATCTTTTTPSLSTPALSERAAPVKQRGECEGVVRGWTRKGWGALNVLNFTGIDWSRAGTL
eukprot:3309639-Rhodomonas_salina.1